MSNPLPDGAVPLAELGADPIDTTRRDGLGRYLVVPPGGGKLVPYSRVTTVARTLDDFHGLAPWKAAMTAEGLLMRPGLRSQWEALIAEHGSPWYSPAKGAAIRLVEECAAVGGANDRRQIGTAMHRITGLVDQGQVPHHLSAESQALVDAYLKVRAEAGVGIVAGAIELTVVLDDHQVAGTLDRLALVPGFDLPLISDLKTGRAVDWLEAAVQLAGYSRASAIYKQGLALDGSQDQRLPMPAVDQGTGLIFWLDAGTGVMGIYLVDLAAGWAAFEQSMWVRGWRRAHPERPLQAPGAPAPAVAAQGAPTPDTGLEAALEASLAAAAARHPATPQPVVQPVAQPVQPTPAVNDQPWPPAGWADREPQPSDGPDYPHDHAAWEQRQPTPQVGWEEEAMPARRAEAASRAEGIYTAQVQDWLQDRINAIGQHAQARTALGRAWPPDLPTLRSYRGHQPEQLDAIERLLDSIEKRYELPFGPPKPEPDVGRIVALFPGSSIVNVTSDSDPGGTPA